MGSLISRSFNWLTGGSFQETFCLRMYKKATQSEDNTWPWRVVSFLDWMMKEQDHCFKEWDYYRDQSSQG